VPPLLEVVEEEDLRASMVGSSICADPSWPRASMAWSSIYAWIRRGPRALRLQARGDASSRGRGGASFLLRLVAAAAPVSLPQEPRCRRGDAEMDVGVGGMGKEREREWREGEQKSNTENEPLRPPRG
jgi:hypothetical protein